MTLTGAALAQSYDPRPRDVDRYLTAIARRNIAHVRYSEADAALTAVRLRGVTDTRDWVRVANDAQNELEHARRDLIWARGRFEAERRRGEPCQSCGSPDPAVLRGRFCSDCKDFGGGVFK